MRKLVGLALFVQACGGSQHAPRGRPPPTEPAPSVAVTAAPAADAGASDAAAPAKVELSIQPVEEPAIAPAPHVEIKFPFAEQHIPLKKAARYRVRLAVDHWPAADQGGGVALALDDFRPRRLDRLDEPPRLGGLVPADRTLEAGEHVLVAIAVRGDGVTLKPGDQSSLEPFGAVHFWVGARGKPGIDMNSPMLFSLQPLGTYNGDKAADNVLLDFYLLGARLGEGKGSVEAHISGPGVERRLAVKDWHARRIRGLPSGDYRVELTLRGADGKPMTGPHTHATRTITVNRDAPDGGKYP